MSERTLRSLEGALSGSPVARATPRRRRQEREATSFCLGGAAAEEEQM
jgi:hypothetical protein